MPPKKKKKKTSVKQYQPCCPPAPRRRRAPVYMPRQPPQFYAPLPTPQTQFDIDTVRRVVQDEFKRYHAPRQIIQVKGIETQTDFPDDVTVQLDDMSAFEGPTETQSVTSERSFGMSAALEEMRKEGSAFGVRRGEQIAIESQIEQERLREREQELFTPAPRMAQQTELRGFMEGAMSRAEAKGMPFTLPPDVERELVGF